MSRRAGLAVLAGVAAAALAAAPAAEAHGLVQRTSLPIPEWLFGWAAAIVLVASFAALAVLWPRPRLEEPRWRPLPGLGRVARRAGRSRSRAPRSASRSSAW